MKEIFNNYKRLAMPYIEWADRHLVSIVNFIIGFIIGGGIMWINTSWQL